MTLVFPLSSPTARERTIRGGIRELFFSSEERVLPSITFSVAFSITFSSGGFFITLQAILSPSTTLTPPSKSEASVLQKRERAVWIMTVLMTGILRMHFQ